MVNGSRDNSSPDFDPNDPDTDYSVFVGFEISPEERRRRRGEMLRRIAESGLRYDSNTQKGFPSHEQLHALEGRIECLMARIEADRGQFWKDEAEKPGRQTLTYRLLRDYLSLLHYIQAGQCLFLALLQDDS